MRKLTEFEIVLGRDAALCGEVIDGKVVLQLLAPMKIKGLYIEFCGSAKVRADDVNAGSEAGTDTPNKESSSSRKSFYKDSQLLYGKSTHNVVGDDVELAGGEHEYPFQFVVPPNLPASLESDQAHTYYKLKATINKPWKKDHVIKTPFTVLTRDDRSAVTIKPFSRTVKKDLGLQCCRAGEISMTVQVPRTIYSPGEVIKLQGVLNNNSKKKIECYTFRLRQRTFVRNPIEFGEKDSQKGEKVAEVWKQGIEPGNSVILDKETLLVPPVKTKGKDEDPDTDYFYVLEAKMKPSGAHADLCMTIPLGITRRPGAASPSDNANTQPNVPTADDSPFWHSGGNHVVFTPKTKPAPAVPSNTSRGPRAEDIEDWYNISDRSRASDVDETPQRQPHLYPSLPRSELNAETGAGRMQNASTVSARSIASAPPLRSNLRTPLATVDENSDYRSATNGMAMGVPDNSYIDRLRNAGQNPQSRSHLYPSLPRSEHAAEPDATAVAVAGPRQNSGPAARTVVHTNIPSENEVYASRVNRPPHHYNARANPASSTPGVSVTSVQTGRPVGLMFSGGSRQGQPSNHYNGSRSQQNLWNNSGSPAGARVHAGGPTSVTPVTNQQSRYNSPPPATRHLDSTTHGPTRSEPNLASRNFNNAPSNYPSPFTYTPAVVPSAPPPSSVFGAR